MGHACGMNDVNQNAYRVFVGKPDVKRPLGRPRCRCKTIETDGQIDKLDRRTDGWLDRWMDE
jgi:hypothetical protein